MAHKMRLLGKLALIVVLSLACALPAHITDILPDENAVEENVSEPEPDAPAVPSGEGNGDCGDDLDCFAQALRRCQKTAQFLFVSEIDFFGAISTSEIRFTIQGEDDGGCALHLMTESVDLIYGDEIIAQLKEGGLTEEQIEEQRQMAVDGLEAGMYDDTCVGAPDDFVALLENWQSGQYALSDFDPFNCTGKIFSNMDSTFEITVEAPKSGSDIPEGYTRQGSYTGDCLNRPEGTSCLGFEDDYIWLINEPYIQERADVGEWDGYVIQMVTAPSGLYYHILGTDYIKIAPRD